VIKILENTPGENQNLLDLLEILTDKINSLEEALEAEDKSQQERFSQLFEIFITKESYEVAGKIEVSIQEIAQKEKI